MRGVAVAQLAVTDADRGTHRVVQLRAELVEAPSSLDGRDVGKRTEELVAADSHEQVVGPHVLPERVRDRAQHLVPGRVTPLVVHGLKPIHVHEGGDEVVALPPGALHLGVQLVKAHPPPPGAGQLIRSSLVAVMSGPTAVACPVLAILYGVPAVQARLLAVACRAAPAGAATAAQLLHLQGVPVGQFLPDIPVPGLAIAAIGHPIALR